MNRYENLTDDGLVQLVQNSDPDAFVELSERYMALIRAKAASFHSFALEAADLWQEGLLGLYKAAITYHKEREASFQTYAGVCISNQIVTAYRVQCSRKNLILTDSLSLEEEERLNGEELTAVGDGSDPEMQVIASESVRAVNDHLHRSLSPLEQDVLRLYLNGFSYREIARELEVSQKAADNAMQRIRRKLKKILA